MRRNRLETRNERTCERIGAGSRRRDEGREETNGRKTQARACRPIREWRPEPDAADRFSNARPSEKYRCVGQF
ncbi:ribulo-/ribitol kinase [Anopheles sinensis]|uniref:Ribulo-/ribitol kinase n=1 Tax=Anopheles sinensis TaxID=74873 RepID=A0A084VZG0_ANOSI|nr:ribulo-/ribitol kinase [Anopheles sinensis]